MLMMIGRELIQRITIFASSGIKMITQGYRDFWELCFWKIENVKKCSKINDFRAFRIFQKFCFWERKFVFGNIFGKNLAENGER